MEEYLCGLAEISGHAGAGEGKITGGSAEKIQREQQADRSGADIYKKQKKIAGAGKTAKENKYKNNNRIAKNG